MRTDLERRRGGNEVAQGGQKNGRRDGGDRGFSSIARENFIVIQVKLIRVGLEEESRILKGSATKVILSLSLSQIRVLSILRFTY